MILIDVGNTSIHFAWAKAGRIVKIRRLDSKTATLREIRNMLSKRTPIIACSVVPRITALLQRLPNVKIVGKDIKVPIQCRYNKAQVGQDRLVAAYAAKKLYPRARIVVDFGTAITMDFLNARGAYEGGIILPGLGSTLRVLSGCAMLPNRLRLTHVGRLIPRNTADSINKGIEAGFCAMLNTLIRDYQKELKLPERSAVVITGGEGFFVARRLFCPTTLDSQLVLKGLKMLGSCGR